MAKQQVSLLDAAREACARAHVPYSNSPVGAAVLTTDVKIFIGCKVENGFKLCCTCAEGNAISAMVASGRINLGAIMTYTPSSTPAMPCVICGQMIRELNPEAIIFAGYRPDPENEPDRVATVTTSLQELFPYLFRPHHSEQELLMHSV